MSPGNNFFQRTLFPLIFPDDPEKNRLAQFLHAFLFVLIWASLALNALLLLFVPTINTRTWLALSAPFVFAGLLLILRSGRLNLTLRLLVIFLWLACTLDAINAGGLNNPFILGSYIVITLFAGAFLGRRTAIFIAVLCMATGLTIAIAQARGVLVLPATPTPLVFVWGLQAVTLLSALYLLVLSVTSLSDLLARTRIELEDRKRNETALRDSEQRFRTIFEQAGMGAVLSDTSGTILQANSAFQKMVGYTADELQNISFRQLTPAEDLEHETQLVRQLSSNTELDHVNIEKRYIRKDGSTIWARLTFSFIRDGSGEPQYGMAIVEDITAARQAQAALQQRDAILESVAFAAGQFLQSTDWRQNIQGALESLGRNTSASHAYLFENHLGPDGSLVTSMRYEWVAPGAQPEIDEPVYQNNPLIEPGLERWHAALSQGKPFYGNLDTFLPEEVEAIAPTGPVSLIEVPIFVQDQWWGFIGFDDIRYEREWTAAEIDAFQAAAAIIGAAISRQATDTALRDKEITVRTLGDNLPGGGIYQLAIGPGGEHRFTYMSEGIRNITGIPVEEMLERPELVIDQILPEDRQRLLEIEQEVNQRLGSVDFDIRIRAADGQIKWCHHRGAVRQNANGTTLWDTVIQDVTSRKQAEEEIRKLNTELEQRVRQRTADLQSANQELEAFAYSVSHDLRGPLRHLDGYSKLLLEDYAQILDADGQSLLNYIRLAAQQMGQLIDDLLKLSRTTRAEMHPADVDLSTLAEQILAELRQAEPERQVEVLIQPQLLAWGDASLLQVVLGNLLRNAWKFTARTPGARIVLGGYEETGQQVFFVRDNGAGFDMKYVNKLFKPFQRLHNPEEFEGTGIGLATVRRIVQRHGGQVWAESEVGGGATFYFTLLNRQLGESELP